MFERSSARASLRLVGVLALLACAPIEPPPARWPAADPRTPAAFEDMVVACREAAAQRGRRAKHTLRGEQALAWLGGLSVAGGAATATLAGALPNEREGIVGAALVGTVAAGAALAGRFLTDGDEARWRYERSRAHELAARRALWTLAELETRLAALPPGSPEYARLHARRLALRDYVHAELTSCTDPTRERAPAPLPP